MKDKLKELGFCLYKQRFYDGHWEFMFNPDTNILYSHCEVNGDIEKIAKITTPQQLEEELINNGFNK